MLTLYTWTTPNGRKPTILLEELGVAYNIRTVNIGKDEQFGEDFLKISPNNKIPALVDDELKEGSISIFESGAILLYLADKYGKFIAPEGNARYKALEWLFWQVGGLGPMLGQLNFFEVFSKEKSELASKRFITESQRLLGVLEKRLSEGPYLAGEEYTIADIASYPWVVAVKEKQLLNETFDKSSAINAWLERIGSRPAVQRGMALPKVD